EDTVVMPQGLLGFAERRRFGLAELPESIGRRFKLLQSLEEPTLCFIVAA
ncbi:MAG: flagellar assembly protein FliW, partial [Gammaproteobacteria bacterium]|nr:flagellar assembly protein FliW [Gammaproteobacteria bacterium]